VFGEDTDMKYAMVVLALLAATTGAQATVRVFVTSSSSGYGLEDNANAFTPTVSTVTTDGRNLNTYDYYADYYGSPGPIRVGTFPPADAPSGTTGNPILIPPNEFAYIWLQFQNEPAGAYINMLQISVTAGPVSTTYYLCNNSNTLGTKRWDGTATPPDYPEWHNNPQTMVAVTAYGIQNLSANAPGLLYRGGASRITLLGALAAPYDGTTHEIVINHGHRPWL
jgi:hypothetical protein